MKSKEYFTMGLLDSFNKPVYVQLFANKITARSVESGKIVTLTARKPFSHPRSLIGNFANAEELLGEALKQLAVRSWFAASPIVIIHPMEILDGGLTQIEIRTLRELGAGAGAREVFIYQGKELRLSELKSDFRKLPFERVE